ncbi:MAG: hypothetical protein OHK0053_25750 [Microscillaceae bacterium]
MLGLAGIIVSACEQQARAPQSIEKLLTAHKWQLVKEEGLNLPSEALQDNIIEMTPQGDLVYYEGKEEISVFTKNRWKLSPDEKKVIEILPDGSTIESEIIEITPQTLKLRYHEEDGLGNNNTIIEQYQRYSPKMAQL